MIYITVPAKDRTHQISIDEFLSDDFQFSDFETHNIPYTRTFKVDRVPYIIKAKTPVRKMLALLKDVTKACAKFDPDNMSQYYKHYTIPKKSGGKRPIDEPNADLRKALKLLKDYLENTCQAKWHTSAYAYVKGRSTRDDRIFHAKRGSRWFEYLDFHNFFGSFSFDYAWETLQNIYPFCLICEDKTGKANLKRCLQTCFLNGGLPQGTPISPMLTNLLMIPFDFEISKKLAHDMDQPFYYTRYADDICVSASRDFDKKEIESLVLSLLKERHAPFVLNTSKTHYCSFNGHNFHLGLCYNNTGHITVGYRKKDTMKAMLTNFALDTKSVKYWPMHDVQVLLGQYNYCKQQEPDYFEYVIQHLSEKFGIDIMGAMIQQIRNGGGVMA